MLLDIDDAHRYICANQEIQVRTNVANNVGYIVLIQVTYTTM